MPPRVKNDFNKAIHHFFKWMHMYFSPCSLKKTHDGYNILAYFTYLLYLTSGKFAFTIGNKI